MGIRQHKILWLLVTAVLLVVSARVKNQKAILFESEDTNDSAYTWVEVTRETVSGQVKQKWKDIKHGLSDIKNELNGIKSDLGDGIKKGIEDVKHRLEHPKSSPWAKVLTHEDFPEYEIRLKESKLCDSTVKQYSGYLDVSDQKHFFFWSFESRNDPSNDPIVLWLNGGPGCSSLTGLFFELGPCMVNDDGSDTIVNPYSWNNNATVIFLDQPTNVGYSYGSGVTNTLTAAKDVYAFLQIFFKQFPRYANLKFHIAGESYAGHYIPAIAAEINNNNQGTSRWIQSTKPKHLLHINLDSILIGNGLVDPLVQYKYYPDMACNSSYDPVLTEDECDEMRNAYPRCASLIKSCYKSQNVFNCLPASMYCNRAMISSYQNTGQNVYDVRKKCEGGGLCYPILGVIEKYLNREEVKSELGAQVDTYKSCNMEVNFRFQMAGDWMRPFHLLIPPLMENDVRVLIYAGDADFICNWIGNWAWAQELEWPGKEQFNREATKDWVLEDGSGLVAGTVRTHKGFTFLRIFEAGHMAPYDQPLSSLDFFNRWIQKRDL